MKRREFDYNQESGLILPSRYNDKTNKSKLLDLQCGPNFFGSSVDEDPYWAYVVFQSYFDTNDIHNGQNRFIDEKGHELTSHGSVTLDTSIKKYGIGSVDVLSSCTSCRIEAAASPDWAFSNEEFTVEGWVYFTSLPTYACMMSTQNAANTTGWSFWRGVIGGNQSLYFYIGSEGITVNWSPSINTWYFIQAIRRKISGSYYYQLAVDGTQIGSNVVSTAVSTNDSNLVILNQNRLSYGYPTSGKLDTWRITKGFARPIELPTKAFLNTGPTGDPYWSDVIFLSYFDVDGPFVDEKGHTLTAYSVGKDTGTKKFGAASVKGVPPNGRIEVAASTDWDFGTGNFGVEGWVNFISHTANQVFASNWATSTTGWTFQLGGSGTKLNFWWGDTKLIEGNFSITNGTWYFVQVVRNGNILELGIDGTVVATVTDTTNMSSNTQLALTGYTAAGGYGYSPDGYMDTWRITKRSRSIRLETAAFKNYA